MISISVIVPFYNGNEKKAEIGVCHKNLIPSVTAALRTDNGLRIIQHFLPLTDSKNEKHSKSPSRVNL